VAEDLAPEPLSQLLVNEIGDDRDDIRPGDRVLLIVENDIGFARFLLDAAREKGFKGLVTSLGAAALALTREYKPDAITLDIYLPDIAGWRVLERLKNDVATRHIPVCVISTDESRDRALSSGALAFVAKPIQSRDVLDGLLDYVGDFVGRPMKSLLVVEPDADRRGRMLESIDAEDVQVTAVPDGPAALQTLRERRIDCVVLGPDVACGEWLLANGESSDHSPLGKLPVIVYGDGELAHDGDGTWKRLAETCTVRRAHSPDRLLDLATFFLHRAVAKLPEAKRQMLLDLHQSDKLLAGKKVLIVDDDMRNIFALSTVLEEHEMEIVSADNGRDAIAILKGTPDIDIVLMDIMMPEMDGMETMREVRKIPTLKNLPIVAVTAKAMKGDREKCIEAGAWDYLSKPVDTEQMLAVLRAWLHR
jgi:CheY-like chemotaxis protein